MLLCGGRVPLKRLWLISKALRCPWVHWGKEGGRVPDIKLWLSRRVRMLGIRPHSFGSVPTRVLLARRSSVRFCILPHVFGK